MKRTIDSTVKNVLVPANFPLVLQSFRILATSHSSHPMALYTPGFHTQAMAELRRHNLGPPFAPPLPIRRVQQDRVPSTRLIYELRTHTHLRFTHTERDRLCAQRVQKREASPLFETQQQQCHG